MADYKKMQENIKLICERVSMGERMAMLAEETAELADAAQLLLESITESRRRGRKFACGSGSLRALCAKWSRSWTDGRCG